MKKRYYMSLLCLIIVGVVTPPTIAKGDVINTENTQNEEISLLAGLSATLNGLAIESQDLNQDNVHQNEKSADHDDVDVSNLAVYTGNDALFIYQSNTLSGNVIGMIPSGGAGTIHADGDNWYLISSGAYTGFVKKENLLTGAEAMAYADKHFSKEAVVSTDTAFSYETKECDGAVMSVLAKDTVLKVSHRKGNAYALTINGVKSFIPAKDVSVHNIYETAVEPNLQTFEDLYPEEALGMYGSQEEYSQEQIVSSPVNTPDASCTDLMNEIVSYAMQFLGNPYVWGGESLTDGCDCSGFVMKIYEHFGYSLPHGSAALRGCGQDVCGSVWDEKLALPGDVICYDGHVGIYIGDGNMINASNPRDGIKISSVTARSDFICARRIVSGRSSYGDLDETEFNELCRIVEAEAGGESVDSRVAVCDVILNRVASDKFPNTIHDVIFSGRQFSPVSNGRYFSVIVSESTKDAVRKALSEPDHSMGALYFMNPKCYDPSNVKWFYSALTYLFSYGDVEFFR